DCITPLLDEAAAPADLNKATWAIFYSISNTQPGLRGVSFGDSLIKRVVDTLKEELPKLRYFATLSPIPGFRGWLGKQVPQLLTSLDNKQRDALRRVAGTAEVEPAQVLKLVEDPGTLGEKSPVRQLLLQWAAQYLVQGLTEGKPLDPVARFHLGNGARVERLNWSADPSGKGLKQSYGLMVNYLYDLKRLDKHRVMLMKGAVPASGEVQSLLG
ncbi:MAG TPA: malonyl-CoA decarboxylase family protein, partial [Janthinobacterium sp.]|nr:malonyl-CoA decarboxylase family protein [Janthinobacterium sp.]